jgi:hypothetical protein
MNVCGVRVPESRKINKAFSFCDDVDATRHSRRRMRSDWYDRCLGECLGTDLMGCRIGLNGSR